MIDFDIKSISLDTVSKSILVRTKDGHEIVLGFVKEGYFDLVSRIAKIQSEQDEYVPGIRDFHVILSVLRSKLEQRPKERRREYGLIEGFHSFEEYWRRHFQNKGRQYTIIKEKPDSVSKDDLTKHLLRNKLFGFAGSKDSFTFWIGPKDAKIFIPDTAYSEPHMVKSTEIQIGNKKSDLISAARDFEFGIAEEDIHSTILKDRVPLPPEIDNERTMLLRHYDSAIKEGWSHPWPGCTYSIQSIATNQDRITESLKLHFRFNPTDYFTFLAVQNNLDRRFLRDEQGHLQSLRERFLPELNPRSPSPELAQSVSATILLLVNEGKKQLALIAKRSSDEALATGRSCYVLSVNETPRRRPTEQEIKLLENVPPDRIKPDSPRPNPFFNALVRGAREELGIKLSKEAITLFTLGLEPARYMYVLIGLAETDMSKKYVQRSFQTARDATLEYAGFHFVPFTPEDIYDFMVRFGPWGSEAEVGLYQALIFKFGNERVQNVFEDYPAPRI
jgi:hypothetical protein